MIGYHPQVILAGRRINDGMGPFISRQTIKHLIQGGNGVKGAKVNMLGLTFKEDCPDLRNSKVVDIIRELNGYGLEVYVHDPVADAGEAKHEYGLELTPWERLPKADAIVGSVAHKQLIQRPISDFSAKLKKGGVFVDVKSRYDRHALQTAGFSFWRL